MHRSAVAEFDTWDTFEKSRVYSRAGIESYWILRPLPDRIELTEFRLVGRDYEAVAQ